ncbi:hypothetical protein EAF00_007834 [Botryotinia globosa]|nr:hypothetical protein EAF00_007834 [Botryotinia globosa]
MDIYRYINEEFPNIDYHGRLTFRCAFSTEFLHANGSPPALLHNTRISREIALKSHRSCFSFIERPIYYNPEKDLVYINRLNDVKRDIAYRKNPFEGASEEDKRRITHLAFNYDNLHMEQRPLVLNTKPRHDDIVHETEIYEIYGSSDKEDEEPEFEIVSDIDDDDDTVMGSGHFDSSGEHFDVDFTITDDSNDGDEESLNEDSGNGYYSLSHSVSPRDDYEGSELTSRKLQFLLVIGEVGVVEADMASIFIERNEFPPLDDVTFPMKILRDNPDWRLPRVQRLSFEELGCPISNYNKHWLYLEERFVCKFKSDDDSELLGSSDWEG